VSYHVSAKIYVGNPHWRQRINDIGDTFPVRFSRWSGAARPSLLRILIVSYKIEQRLDIKGISQWVHPRQYIGDAAPYPTWSWRLWGIILYRWDM